VLIPIVAAILLALLNKHCARWFADLVAVIAVVAMGTVSVLLLRVSLHAPQVYWFGAWTPRDGVALGVDFYADPFSAGLAAFISVLGLAALVFSLRYFDVVENLFHVLMLGFMGAMAGFSLSGDLFNLFVFFELMSVSAFALCGYKTEDPGSQQGAINFAVMNTIGGFLALLGIGMLYSRTGALNMAQIGRTLGPQADLLVVTAFVCILCGFFVKAAAFPFHFWLADAHAVAPTPVCVLFSGVMVELGVYGVARVYWSVIDGPLVNHHAALTATLLVIGAITALLGAIMCFVQRHIKRLLAFSTISHVGLLIIGFALLRPDALAGAGLYLIGHGAAKASLFLVAGILLHCFGSVDEIELRGQGRRMPWTGAVFLLGGMSLAGLVPFLTFVGEHSVSSIAEHMGKAWLEGVFLAAGALTAGAVFRVYGRVFLGYGNEATSSPPSGKQGREHRETKGPHDGVPGVMWVPAAILIVFAGAAGLLPGISQVFRAAALQFTDHAGYVARVLDGALLPRSPVSPEHAAMLSAIVRSLAATLLAIVFASLALSDFRRRSWYTRPFSAALKFIRQLHTGKVGDYVAYFTFGVAAIGVALAMLVAW
jgi:multicomponent Na+:H+ antiporter subunit D